MSSTDRQNRLLLAEDWQKIYQSFKYADFKSYDFENLRRTMINYIRQNYPEDFNDYIESSEYLALIDMIAFLGQNISYRVDLNARENFIELAERRESVLRMARLLSYNVTRNQAAKGLLKITSVSTSENMLDSNGVNLSGKTVKWNDNVNTNWYEQFIKVINASFNTINRFGTPTKLDIVGGVPTEKYKINVANNILPIFTFNSTVNGADLEFEVVSADISNGSVIEEPPLPGNTFGILYKDNGQGPGSTQSGFFLNFVQGSLQKGDFTVNLPTPNQTINVNVTNINNSDVWLYSLNENQLESDLWTKVEAVEGNNIIYNSINKGVRNIFSVLTRTDDRISLIFSDGTFGTLPKGTFRSYYRRSANRDYDILPADIKNVTLRVPYTSSRGRVETMIIVADLASPVYNANSTETTESIKTNAPSTYYTQNRLITGEDYNVGPLGVSQEIIKIKSINRTSSGINRYYDLTDATGKYSTTNLFANDGILYKEKLNNVEGFSFVTRTDIENTINNKVTSILANNNVRNFYLSEFTEQNYTELNLSWSQYAADSVSSSGFITDGDINFAVSSATEGPLRYLEPGALVKFSAPTGYYFDKDNKLLFGTKSVIGDKSEIWTKVVNVFKTGQEATADGLGGILFDNVIPTDALLTSVKIKFVRDIIDDVKSQMIDQIFAYRTFGLRYDLTDRQWKVILQEDLNILGDFSLGLAGDTTGQKLDASWIVLFETNGDTYTITYRSSRYIFESKNQTRFYFDNNKKIYDSKTGKIVRDKVSVLNVNRDLFSTGGLSPFTQDYDWAISSEYRDLNGYVDSKKVEVVFYDGDDDGIVDDPELFEKIVKQDSNDYIFLKKYVYSDSEFYQYTDEEILIGTPNVSVDKTWYDPSTDVFYQSNSTTRKLTELVGYKAYRGRDNIKFQYTHASDENARIDPSSSNIIDLYVLTKTYDTLYRQYLLGTIASQPLPQSSDSLYRDYGDAINQIKSISDEVIYHPVKYKVLFGSKADNQLKATFKIVKSKERVTNDNDIKSRVIEAINQYFALENWDFGETFYWSELSTYIMNSLSPDITSIVIVPSETSSYFGSLFEVNSESDELFISGATVSDVEIITANTAEKLKAQGSIITETTNSNAGIQSTSSNIIVGGGY